MSNEREFMVSGYLTISVCKTVSAKSRKDALQKARDLDTPSLCCHCSSAGKRDPGTWELNGFDDPPEDCVRDIDGSPIRSRKTVTP